MTRFVGAKDEERTGEMAINLELSREAHFGGGLLHLYFERSSLAQIDRAFTGENTRNIWAAHGKAWSGLQGKGAVGPQMPPAISFLKRLAVVLYYLDAI